MTQLNSVFCRRSMFSMPFTHNNHTKKRTALTILWNRANHARKEVKKMKKIFIAIMIAILITINVTAALCEDNLFIGNVTGINAAEGTITVTNNGKDKKEYTVFAEGYKMGDLVSVNKDTLEVNHYSYPEKTPEETRRGIAEAIGILLIVLLMLIICITDEFLENFLNPIFDVILIGVIVCAIIVLR